MLGEDVVQSLVDDEVVELDGKLGSVRLQSEALGLAVVAAFPLTELTFRSLIDNDRNLSSSVVLVDEVTADGTRIGPEAKVQAVVVDVALIAGTHLSKTRNRVGRRGVKDTHWILSGAETGHAGHHSGCAQRHLSPDGKAGQPDAGRPVEVLVEVDALAQAFELVHCLVNAINISRSRCIDIVP